MKKLLVTITLSTLVTLSLQARGGHGHRGAHHGNYNTQTNISQTATTSSLTQQQIDDLLFMYQEEKLARDVYITLGNTWGSQVFLNIQNSEQKHQNAIKNLLVQYNLPIPVASDEIGVFEDENLQSLYNQLISKGEQSLKDALEVGVLVEETDIADLEEKMVNVPDTIKRVYNNLLQGSYRHLEAFNSNLGNTQ